MIAVRSISAWTAVLLCAAALPASAQSGRPDPRALRPVAAPADEARQEVRVSGPASKQIAVIVQLEDAPLARYDGSRPGLAAPRPSGGRLDARSAEARGYLAYLDGRISDLQTRAARALPGSQLVYRYRHALSGAAMSIRPDQLEALRRLPGVKAVYRSELRQLTTDASVEFIGAPALWAALGGAGSAGEGVVVGVLDTGIWPEHPSFADPDPSGRPYPAPPPSWTGSGCEFGSAVPGDVSFTCNHKLLAARRFLQAYERTTPLLPTEFPSARDDDGHGSHTASTAAGNAAVPAVTTGAARGRISGIAPRAHVAAYKVCGEAGCVSADIVMAIDQAIADGVDVINFSISGGSSPYSDPVSQAFLDAHAAGIFVAASAGNSGPGADTVDHREAWVTTVAASTQNRGFAADVRLSTAGGAQLELRGGSLGQGVAQPVPLLWAGDFGDPLCEDPGPSERFAGAVVICDRGVNARVAKGANAARHGALGMLLRNVAGGDDGLVSDTHFIPTVHIHIAEGERVLAFLEQGGADVRVELGAGVAEFGDGGDVLAHFSSRGGPGQSLGVSKPDLSAPGVEILAGYTGLPATDEGGPDGELFRVLQGTSMSSPHVAGAAALLVALHPSWTPGQIQSALMTTARTELLDSDGVTPADAFQVGSGRIDLTRAGSPGLTISAGDTAAEAADAFRALQGELWNANYPSIYLPLMPGSMHLVRSLRSALPSNAFWRVEVDAPPDVRVKVPTVLALRRGREVELPIEVDARAVPEGESRTATLWLSSGQHRVHLPLALVRGQPSVELSHRCDPANAPRWTPVPCELRVVNTALQAAPVQLSLQLPRALALVPGSVEGAQHRANALHFAGTLAPAANSTIAASALPGVNGYVSMGALGLPPNVAFQDDEELLNFNVPPFEFDGTVYSRIGMASNGYLVVGGGDEADLEPALLGAWPSPERPNAVLAPFWTDLNPAAGGRYSAYGLTDGISSWNVFEWEDAPNFAGGALNSFQVWIGAQTNGRGQEIWFSYGPVLSSGDPASGVSVGAENASGSSAAVVYHAGAGSVPLAGGDDIDITSTPGEPGGEQVIRYRALGWRPGEHRSCAELDSPIFAGTNIACAPLQITR